MKFVHSDVEMMSAGLQRKCKINEGGWVLTQADGGGYHFGCDPLQKVGPSHTASLRFFNLFT